MAQFTQYIKEQKEDFQKQLNEKTLRAFPRNRGWSTVTSSHERMDVIHIEPSLALPLRMALGTAPRKNGLHILCKVNLAGKHRRHLAGRDLLRGG